MAATCMKTRWSAGAFQIFFIIDSSSKSPEIELDLLFYTVHLDLREA